MATIEQSAITKRGGRLGKVKGVGHFRQQPSLIGGRAVRHLDTAHGRYTAVHVGRGRHNLMYTAKGEVGVTDHLGQGLSHAEVHAAVGRHHNVISTEPKTSIRFRKKPHLIGHTSEHAVYDVTPESAAAGDRFLLLTSRKK